MPLPSIRTAIVGYGVSGRVFHAPLVTANESYSLKYIVTSDSERRRHATEHNPGVDVLTDFDALITSIDEGSSLDLVVLGTPPGSHRAQAEALLKRGISVVVDKPFAPSAHDAEALIELSNQTNAVLTVFQNRRWDGDFLTLRKLIDDGTLGEIQTFESRFEWLSPRSSHGGWKDTTSVTDGGGILLDVGSHLVDQAVQLFGPINDSYAEIVRHSKYPGADEDSFVSIQHESGVRTRLWMNSRAVDDAPRFHVVGSQGTFTSFGKDPQESQLGSGVMPSDPAYGYFSDAGWANISLAGERVHPAAERGNYPQFYELLSHSLHGVGPVPIDPSEPGAVLRFLESLHQRFPLQ